MIFFLVFLSIDFVSANSEIFLDEGSRYLYTVVCTDICGFDIWDNSKLPANLYIEIKEHNSNKVTILTSFNLTIEINDSINTDSNHFTFTEYYNPITRENLEQEGRYSWQWINDFDNYINVSVPAIFLVHTPASYMNNTYLIRIASEFEDLEVSNKIIRTQKYEGRWEYNFTKESPSKKIISQLIIYFDIATGFLVRMELEMSEIGPSSDHKTTIVDPIGSFKMIRMVPDSKKIDIMLFSPLLTIPILIGRKKRGKQS
jgi:hypothetical protein